MKSNNLSGIPKVKKEETTAEEWEENEEDGERKYEEYSYGSYVKHGQSPFMKLNEDLRNSKLAGSTNQSCSIDLPTYEYIDDCGGRVRQRSLIEQQNRCVDQVKTKSNDGNGTSEASNSNYDHFQLVRIAVMVVIGGAIMMFYIQRNMKNFPVNPVNINTNLWNEILSIRRRFTSQNHDIWPTFMAGIESVHNGAESIAVFLLLHEDGTENVAECLGREVAKVTVRFVNGTHVKKGTAPPLPLHLKGYELNSLDPASSLTNFRYMVAQSGVMLVTQLDQINGRVAKFFHSFCDSYNPMVAGTAYFFVLKVPSKFATLSHINRKAEETLKLIWNGEMDDSELLPLITRMTSNVMEIHPVSTLSKICTT